MKIFYDYLVKKHYKSLLIIVCLLAVQALADLALPGYTARIVNIGIQQSGIERAAPQAISTQSYYELLELMPDSGKQTAGSVYRELNPASPEDCSLAEEKFGIQLTEPVMYLESSDSRQLAEAELVFSKAFHFSNILNGNTDFFTGPASMYLNENYGFDSTLPAAEQLKSYLSTLTPAQKDLFFSDIYTFMDEFTADTIKQTAIPDVRAEMELLNIDILSLQNKFLISSGLQMLGVSVIGMAALILISFFTARMSSGFGTSLRRDVFSKVLTYSSKELDSFSTASLITRTSNDISQIQQMSAMGVRIVIFAPILATGGIINVLRTNASMAWIVFAAVAVIMSFVLTLFRIATPRFRIIQRFIDKLNLITREILTGLPVIRAFSTNKYEEERFGNTNRDLRKMRIFVNRTMGLMHPFMLLAMNAVTAAILYLGAAGVRDGAMQVGDIMAFTSYTMQIIMSFQMISMISIQLPMAMVAVGRISELLNTDTTIYSQENPKDFDENKKGLVEFRDVSFSYPDADAHSLEGLNFTIEPGQTTAVIGGTGSGKSTLVNLIPRFFDVTEGEILVGGLNIKEAGLTELRDRIGYIPQKSVLFSGTIESNIKFADYDMTDEKMITAAEVAQASEFIDEKPLGYQDPIAQNGSNVSGGQKQRLSIARAVAKNPDIYIFDDSFSALDYKTDIALRRALNAHVSEATVIIVSQRISTVMKADKIIVLDEGRTVGTGTHKDLLKNCEIYLQIAQSQLSEEELNNEQ